MSNYSNIDTINVIGAVPLPVPAGMTVEGVLEAMNYKLSDYDESIEGTTLVLAAKAGSKGLVEIRVVNDKILPVGGKSFPTNKDIESISELFPDDNLFETLNDPIKLQEYYTELKDRADELVLKKVAAKKAKKQAELSKTAAELAEVVDQASVYALKEDSPVQPRIESVMADAVKTLSGLVKLAEEYEVAAIKEAQEKEEHQRVLEQVRAQNSEEA
jgi:hypothetical protein